MNRETEIIKALLDLMIATEEVLIREFGHDNGRIIHNKITKLMFPSNLIVLQQLKDKWNAVADLGLLK